MPSFTTMITLALGLFAASSPVLAFADASSDLSARGLDNVLTGHAMEKRAPGNMGAKCRFNSHCHTNIHFARPSCSARGICGFKCLGGTEKRGNACVRPNHKPECSRNKQCSTDLKHGTALCHRGQCTFQCNKNYHRDGAHCVKNTKSCRNTTCKPVQDGYSTCSAGTCSYHCATYLGYTLFTNSAKTAYRCVNLEVDAENCGTLGNVCQPGYNGNGVPTCEVGTCALDCQGYSSTQTLNGAPYCTDNQ